MRKPEVVSKLVEIHRDYQRAGNFSDAETVVPDTHPLSDLHGFESDFIPEIVRRLARELGAPLAADTRVKNIYVSRDRREKLTITQIAGEYLDLYAPKDDAIHD